MKRTSYIEKFQEVHVSNRWKKPIWNRGGSWVYFGFSKSYFSPNEVEYIFHFFGIDFRFWFSRTIKPKKEI